MVLDLLDCRMGLFAVRRSSSLKVGLRALVPVRAGRDGHGGGRKLGIVEMGLRMSSSASNSCWKI